MNDLINKTEKRERKEEKKKQLKNIFVGDFVASAGRLKLGVSVAPSSNKNQTTRRVRLFDRIAT